MGNCLRSSSSPRSIFRKNIKPLPIETMFKLPSPIPSWPPGEGFASGTIDLGGLQVCQISSFNKVWTAHQGGPGNLGATFYEPSSIPEGFFMLGCYSQPNNSSLFGWVLAAKDLTNDHSGGTLRTPIDYTLIWSSDSSNIKQDGIGYIWLPTPPDGYKSMGSVVTSTPEKPPLNKIRCVRSDFTDLVQIDTWVWGPGKETTANGINVFSARPAETRTQAFGVATGTFIAQNSGTAVSISCLKNVSRNLSAMPNLNQVEALVQSYSPWVYFHPDEQYLPSSVSWFFQNGALLYTKGGESTPISIKPTGSNLPQGGSNDGAYWLDLPIDGSAKEKLKKGDLQDAEAYLHIKPILGATFTDVAIWVFYPFNGPARAKVEVVNVSLGKIGQHVGDWEHVTLRISNFNGELRSVYFSEHSGGCWVNASELEFQNGNKPVAYASLHGHALFPKAGLVLQGNGGIGIRNDMAKSKMVMNTGVRAVVVAAEYLSSPVIVEPPWLNYAREWGPKLSYDIAEEIKKVEKFLPGTLKRAFEKFIKGLPNEVLGEEGPTGPKMKNNW
ncbi:hypothetical protein RJ639_043252, partial [Escallonia herrerae]